MKKAIKTLSVILFAASIVFFSGVIYFEKTLPNQYYSLTNQDFNFNSLFPFQAQSKLNVDDNNELKADASATSEYNVDIKLFGLFPIKEAKVKIVPSQTIIPGGEPFGMKMFSDGVMVTGFSEIKTAQGNKCPAKEAGIEKGDLILSINNIPVRNNDDVVSIIEKSPDGSFVFQIKRGKMALSLKVTAAKSEIDSKYKTGIWVRDSSAGIGTITFYNIGSNSFAGLGHPICDVDTGEIIPLKQGEVVAVDIDSVKKSVAGAAGELKGHFKGLTSIGALWSNRSSGIYGNITNPLPEKESITVALKQDIKVGTAYIYTTIQGNVPKKYEIYIEKINFNQNIAETKNMVIRITDPELLAITGGIVQGMSGSPIIQNDKLIGAVTHVFLNDPVRGYGIFAESMREELKTIEKDLKLAS